MLTLLIRELPFEGCILNNRHHLVLTFNLYPCNLRWSPVRSQGSFTVRLESINASEESVQSSLTVVPEFPIGIAAVAAALAIGATIAARRTSIFAGKTY